MWTPIKYSNEQANLTSSKKAAESSSDKVKEEVEKLNKRLKEQIKYIKSMSVYVDETLTKIEKIFY